MKLSDKIWAVFWVVVALLLIVVPIVYAGEVSFVWDANEEPVLGYRIYCSKQSGTYTYGPGSPDLIWQGVTTMATVNVDACGRHYFVCTAFDACDQESGPSNEKDTVIKPHNPRNFR